MSGLTEKMIQHFLSELTHLLVEVPLFVRVPFLVLSFGALIVWYVL